MYSAEKTAASFRHKTANGPRQSLRAGVVLQINC